MSQNDCSPFSRIIVEVNFGHWAARFEGSNDGWGGDTPGTAVERLWEAHLNSQAAQRETERLVTGKDRQPPSEPE